MRRASPLSTTAQQRGQDRTLEQELCARRRGRCNVFGGANDDGRIETLPLFIGSSSTVRLGKPGCCVSGPTAQFNETALDIGCTRYRLCRTNVPSIISRTCLRISNEEVPLRLQ